MSTANLELFRERVKTDAALVDRIKAATSGKSGASAAAALVDLAAREGFEFTASEAMAVGKAKTSPDGALDDATLDRVAGGDGFEDFIRQLLGLGGWG